VDGEANAEVANPSYLRRLGRGWGVTEHQAEAAVARLPNPRSARAEGSCGTTLRVDCGIEVRGSGLGPVAAISRSNCWVTAV
jgi:hypothetical protein